MIDLGQRGDLLGELLGGRNRGGENLDLIRGRLRIFRQIEEGRDQFDALVAQIHRIGVEFQMQQERRAGEHDDRRRQQHELAMAGDPMVDAGQRGRLHRGRLGLGAENADQRRQEGERREIGDDHADAGDEAELGDAAKLRRQKAEEAREQRDRGQRQRPADAARRRQQGLGQIVGIVALLPVAGGELNAEIDAEADEQHGEGDRDEVEAADERYAEAGRHREAGDDGEEHGEDEPRGA